MCLFSNLYIDKYESPTIQWLQKFTWEQTFWNRMGCYFDDARGGAHPELHPEVSEALRRLQIAEPDKYDQRAYRIIRAHQLCMQKKYLPKEEWITFEEDQKNGRYLHPYIEEVEREQAEKVKWNKEHP